MIAGLLGIAAALVIFILIALFKGHTIDQKIAGPLTQFLTVEGFQPIGPSDPLLHKIKDALRLTNYIGYVEQGYYRAGDDCVLCWTADAEDTNNRLVLVMPQTPNTGPWILLFLPDLTGPTANVIRKTFALSLKSSGFTKCEPHGLGPLSAQTDLYIKDNSPLPSFSKGLTESLPRCGNLMLRSTGALVLLERISLRNERLEQEGRELLRMQKLLRDHL